MKIKCLLATTVLAAAFWSLSTVSAAEVKKLSAPVIDEVKVVAGGIKLTWSDSENAEKTVIYRKESGSKKLKKIATAEKDTYKDETAAVGTEYIYCVKSLANTRRGKVYSQKSETVTAVTYKPYKVKNITGTHCGKENYILLEWEEAEGADKYQVYRSKTKNGKYKRIATTDGTAFEDKTVKNNRVYYYKVRGVNTESGKNVFGSYSSKKAVGSYGRANYTACRGMVYALKKVKIRKSASEKSASVAVLKKGYSVIRASESDNGWTKIIYKGKTRYIKSRYLTEEKMIVRSEDTGRIIVNPEQDLWNLVVVNVTREMPEGYEPVLDEIFDTGKSLDYRVTPYYEAMYKAAKKDGITLTPYSAYRSYDRQKNNFNDLIKKYMREDNLSRKSAQKKASTVILPPGTSEHNLGLAMDICNTEDSFAFSKEYKWLTKNAHKYGFILRYTEEKTDITGIIPEPWHWRFVGVEYAKEIRGSGLCLEEYLEMKGIDF